jgi:hypothetical protein
MSLITLRFYLMVLRLLRAIMRHFSGGAGYDLALAISAQKLEADLEAEIAKGG